MKKLMLVVVLFAFGVLVFAQDQKVTTKETTTKTTEKTVKKSAKTAIKEADLQQPIKDDLAKNYAGAKFDKAFTAEVKGVTTYKVIVTLNEQKWALTYDKDGKFLKKEAKQAGKKKADAPKQ